MTLKRKFDLSLEDEVNTCSKHIKVHEAADIMEIDVAMSDSPSESSETSPTTIYSPLPSPQYPVIELYPQAGSTDLNIGLMQPTGFAHNGDCKTIPKLRVACESGLGGRRTMWSFCEDCGAVALMH